jgi:hypothetical protein
MGQSPKSEAGQESHPGCENKRLRRISPNDLPGFADRLFQVMLLDV